ncbi:MAG: hypothetical protein WCI80_02435 [Bacteroidota bacterium]
MIKKNLYKWHRFISISIAIPVVLWAASGFMHPIMSSFRPQVATQFLNTKPIDSGSVKISLENALSINHIDSLKNVRLIHIDTNWFYQIQPIGKDELIYLSVKNGKLLKKGDWIYAQYLARYFLEGELKADTSKLVNEAKSIIPNNSTISDCCDAATACVLKPIKGTKIDNVHFIRSFDDEYKNINRVLPVYKVQFERKDGIRIYVETSQDRFAFAVDDKRALFTTIFSLIHTWEWLSFLGICRIYIELLFAGLAFLTSLMGIYIFFTTKTKKVKGNELIAARRNHRFTSVIISLFTLMFSFSGFYHALSKFKIDTRDNYFDKTTYQSKNIHLNIDSVRLIVKKPITNISLVTLDSSLYYQVTIKKDKQIKAGEKIPKDLMKEMKTPKPQLLYVNVDEGTILKDGDKKYAHNLANSFGLNSDSEIISDSLITKFEGEYGFVNKRLPIWKIQYAKNNNERFYVETTSGKLSVRIDDKELMEANIFNFLHKHHFMDFAGKEWRDFSTMFWAMAQIVVVVFGFTLYFKSRKRK